MTTIWKQDIVPIVAKKSHSAETEIASTAVMNVIMKTRRIEPLKQIN